MFFILLPTFFVFSLGLQEDWYFVKVFLKVYVFFFPQLCVSILFALKYVFH